MRRGAESVNADSFRVAGFDKRTITNQSGAKQRRRLGVGIKSGQQKAKPFVRQHVVGIAAIERVTGKAGLCAKILPARATEVAFATSPTQPWNADARAGRNPFRALPALDHFTDDFVS